MSRNHPYLGLPDYQFWKNEPGILDPGAFDPVTRTSFKLDQGDAIVTAGSCFAQHVAKHLTRNGFGVLVTEAAHPIISEEVAAEYHYGMFSARYGNLYTARQLRQLLLRAYGEFTPQETAWRNPRGEWLDPFRPQIQPGGFASEAELLADRRQHLAAVRAAIEGLTVFVFTLGLTEAWEDKRDGAVFPLAPGVVGGEFSAETFGFHNFDVAETADDLRFSLDFIRARNPRAKFIITVSPVPLNATAVDRHVFVSTTYSKAVLRVAAEQVCAALPLCDYFPSFEIITSPYARGAYYAADCRAVTETGVRHVMGVFLRHYAGGGSGERRQIRPSKARAETQAHLASVEDVVEVLCDEERITN